LYLIHKNLTGIVVLLAPSIRVFLTKDLCWTS